MESKNLILAVALSIAVLVFFDIFFKKKVNKNKVIIDEVVSENLENLEPKIDSEKQSSDKYKEDRIYFDMQRIKGSLNLYGATIDDVILKDYKEKINTDSANVTVLSKEISNSPFLVRNGWASNSSQGFPNKKTLWKSVKEKYVQNEPIELYWTNKEGVKFERIIEIDENFMMKVTDIIKNESDENIEVSNFSYIQRKNYRPKNKFFILHEGPIGVFNQTLKEVSYDEIEEENKIEEKSDDGWIGITDHYWQVSIFPDNQTSFKAHFKNIKKLKDSIQVDFINDKNTLVNSGQKHTAVSYIFVGAKEVPLIDRYRKQYNITNFDLSVDFGWFYFLTKPLFYALNFLANFFGNFGIGIIVLTIFVRIILFPLANKSFKSMNAMKLVTPEIQRLKERYKDDRTKMNQEMFKLYKDKKINPAAGCLPILLQIPIFFALYKVLFVSIEMRHAPFFGWIRDLSAPDPTSLFNLFGLIPWNPPTFLMVGIWPILMGLTMYLQQKINPPPPDPIQAKIFMILPLVFTFLLATFPSGMVIYWTANNILSIAQQVVILNKQKESNIYK
ncbi:MAG: membrane protein insertase YidC [Rickettsiales bacterium]|nr:membrane protein insertase YidC [Rickettsiales bacterium]